MIPTAKDFFESNYLRKDVTITDAMIEFAKMHVTEALKQAENIAFAYGKDMIAEKISNAYPLENIK